MAVAGTPLGTFPHSPAFPLLPANFASPLSSGFPLVESGVKNETVAAAAMEELLRSVDMANPSMAYPSPSDALLAAPLDAGASAPMGRKRALLGAGEHGGPGAGSAGAGAEPVRKRARTEGGRRGAFPPQFPPSLPFSASLND